MLFSRLRYCVAAAGILSALLLFASASASAEQLRVGVYQNMPQVGYSESGQPQGLYVEILDQIASKEGWQLEYVPTTFAEGLAKLDLGEIDLMADVAPSSWRVSLYAFHSEPVTQTWSQVYARPNSGIHNILDLSGKRVAVLDGSVQHQYFEEAIRAFGVNSTAIPFKESRDALRAAGQGQVDAFVTNPYYGRANARSAGLEDTAIMFAPTRGYFAGRRMLDPEILAVIDRDLRQMKLDPRSIYFQGMSRMIPSVTVETTPQWLKWTTSAAIVAALVSAAWALALRRIVQTQRDSERLLRRASEDLARIFDQSLDVICVLDENLRFARVSRASRSWGYSPDELLGTSCLDLLPASDRTEAMLAFDDVRNGAAAPAMAGRIMRRDGSVACVVWSAVWCPDRLEMYCVVSDGSELKLLRDCQRDASVATHGRDISPELRAHVTAVVDFLQKAVREPPGATQQPQAKDQPG